ncbi:MAG: adaptor protein MecA [Oscillospiraceae bacterium]
MTAFLDRPGRLKIILSEQEAIDYNIPEIMLNKNSLFTQTALINILAEGSLQAGFTPGKDSLIIEIYPSEDGGCVIFFEEERTVAVSIKKNNKSAVYLFEDFEALLFAVKSMKIQKSDLYSLNKKYYFVIYGQDTETAAILEECGEKISQEYLKAVIFEHGKALIKSQAAEKLDFLF